ncbi:tryptophan aminotransferase-related protein 2-like isoform X1 [Cucumis melo var. makuwa]|uniref:Tryptophan aminotransferase-related protein 2-like isoform X1 n=1 Tax=Cucumis melo var. makuwa TaxID=1194695 RepID=A0A5A7UPP4_CUCMM|nr:tryptophan aminotransferase-related protein 2-like isoform X1 [Cucumis melo var. makuwa]TYJ98516.1 tryptophan aminotransferase-related protein 2-like isoform X1 [Cucumis melo var. makuwa]
MGLVSLRNFFVLSLALNVSLILRAINQNEKLHSGALMAVEKGAKVAQMTFLSFPSLSSPSAAAPETQTPLGRERVVNLDQ